ncbi:MAG: hypothetical protein QM661_11305 [Solimonas sp.]
MFFIEARSRSLLESRASARSFTVPQGRSGDARNAAKFALERASDARRRQRSSGRLDQPARIAGVAMLRDGALLSGFIRRIATLLLAAGTKALLGNSAKEPELAGASIYCATWGHA